MKQNLIYTCEEIKSGHAVRSYSGTKLYTIKGACQNKVDGSNARCASHGKEPEYELVTYELKRLPSE